MTKNNNTKEWDTKDQPIIYGEWLESKKDLFSSIGWGDIGWSVDNYDDYLK